MHPKTKELIKYINEEASKVQIEDGVPIVRYINSGKFLETTSREYLSENNIIACYYLLNKLLTLFIEKLKFHKQYKSINSQQKYFIKNLVDKNFVFIEKVREKLILVLDEEYINEENKILEEKMSEEKMAGKKVPADLSEDENSDSHTENDFISIENQESTDHRTMAKINEEDLQIPPKTDSEAFYKKIDHFSNRFENISLDPSCRTSNFDTSTKITEIGLNIYTGNKKAGNSYEGIIDRSTKPIHHKSSEFGSVAGSVNFPPSDFKMDSKNDFKMYENSNERGMKNQDSLKFKIDRSKKPLPISMNDPNLPESSIEKTAGNKFRPVFDRKEKRSIDLAVKSMIASLSNSLTVIDFPKCIHQVFLDISAENNRHNFETCGVLAGVKSNGFYYITHVIIPQQKGGTDSCECLNEEEIITYQDANNLVTLGWIHTHPSQTCFLSSVDLHTQYGYQCLLSESIAVVVSVRYQQMAIYSLTTSGISVIQKCSRSGFHSHDSSDTLFEDAKHITVTDRQVKIADLR